MYQNEMTGSSAQVAWNQTGVSWETSEKREALDVQKKKKQRRDEMRRFECGLLTNAVSELQYLATLLNNEVEAICNKPDVI